ncbi:helix-turn-helix domain-containing protein [Paenibacillus doosanensis]|uniref:Helix-turn-helix protein n=1 Tax=Paenibacillus konkukensis TaxID=2020716 RepID=A0ABY4RZQ2_9BACL|nr:MULTISPECIES: helix-turn-helix transcriptional regulator [Paenibacillus]MCS7459346.1 helix-turn-helix domain-containing protein [Paenibacillus doosanensis]UQZ87139.1 helix-turn-helix protein [Paenibacillus konkukensis]
MEFHVKLKQLRQQQDISLRKLGEKAGVSYSIMNSIENGRFHPTREAVISIANALKYEAVEELLFLAGYGPEI